MDTKDIKKMLDYDSLSEAEKITGKSYKEDKITESLGLINHIQHNKRKNELLESLGDSKFNNTEEDYLKIVKSIGFEHVLIEKFINENGVEERLHVLWNKENSILLVFDTYSYYDDGNWEKEVPKPIVNGGNFYYNWSPGKDKTTIGGSGGYVSNGDNNLTYSTLFNKDFTPHLLPDDLRNKEPKLDLDNYSEYSEKFKTWCDYVYSYIVDNELINIWCSHNDCREAIIFNINRLKDNGSFLKQWKKKPFLWLLHYMDTKDNDYDHEKITLERLNKLPKYVLKSMGL
jgi:hypothetical protein